MEEVDRLYECFKCGISPPESAVRERKRKKKKKTKKNSNSNSNSNSHSNSPGKRISPLVFYGSPQGVPPKRPISLLRLLREIRVDLASLNRRSHLRSNQLWATFPRQNEAINFAKQHADDVVVFSYQDHHSGQRRFLASTYNEFWRRYNIMDPKFRHHYELIQEGLRCHLYFDLEFNKRYNVDKNGDEMVDLLITVVFEALFKKYSIQGSKDWVLELDSSTGDKFSRHLIIRIPRVAFKDNSHVGSFVSEICSSILSAHGTDEKYNKLFVRKESFDEPATHFFVDTAVYTRNRCFRLPMSSKAGKSSFLLPSGRFMCKDMGEEEMFMSSLICNIGVDCEKLLICKMDLECVKTLHFGTEVNLNPARPRTSHKQTSQNCENEATATCSTGNSAFPDIDRFVESIASDGGISGKIRSWYWFSEDALMVYSMSRNRYCERIGRQHKSNHVIYVVDLRRAAYYQKCHDPDCRGYRSPLRPVPLDIVPDLPIPSDAEQLGCQLMFANAYIENPLFESDYSDVYHNELKEDSAVKGLWWLEAIKVADDIESKQEKLDINSVSGLELDEEDENWWVAAERTASQAELMQCN